MNNIELLKLLVDRLEAYEGQAEDKEALSLTGFIESVNGAGDLNELSSAWIGKGTKTDMPHFIDNNIERVIAQHLYLLYRYIKFYSKTALAHSQIKTMEEFGFLITVLQYQHISKTELIRRNIIEKSSGIEIINRLLKSKLFTQKDNPDDQRSQLILLTELGRSELFKIFGNMNTLGKIATGDLSQGEKGQLALLLKKLDQFHYNNYNNKDLRSLEDYLPDAP